ncbi:kinesin motor domain-containing protein [Ditylenchus destructor]|nr:kinesin motor domain-containing protein [Ditylenchus destructor]
MAICSTDDEQSNENIRVSVRIRPESSGTSEKSALYSNELTNSIILRANIKQEKRYRFDNIFSDKSSQERVFNNVGKRIIDGCVAGYNGTIFAYGQTGSGKTYTMIGNQGESGEFTDGSQGIIPRSLEYLFAALKIRKEELGHSFNYSVTCSFAQLYNETLYDLLENSSSRLKIRSGDLDGAIIRSINSSSDASELLQIGHQNRRKAETAMNVESSRSHAIFIVQVRTETVAGGVICRRHSKLNLVDLAGSERVVESGSTGEQLKEACHINKSLLTLARVIRSLSNDSAAYPGYRDSLLTHLLKDSLGGNARTAVIVTIRPEDRYADSTLSSLYFAENVKLVKNRAVLNENIAIEGIETLKEETRRQRAEIEKLREQLDTKNNRIRLLEETLKEIQREKNTEHAAHLSFCQRIKKKMAEFLIGRKYSYGPVGCKVQPSNTWKVAEYGSFADSLDSSS